MENLYFISKNKLSSAKDKHYHKIILVQKVIDEKIKISNDLLRPEIGSIFFINESLEIEVEDGIEYTGMYFKPEFRDEFLSFIENFSISDSLVKREDQICRLNKYLEFPKKDYVAAQLNYVEIKELERLFEKIKDIEKYQDSTYSFLKFLECCTMLYTFLVERIVEKYDTDLQKINIDVLKIERYITENIEKKITLELISKNFGENSKAINEKFKSSKQITINQFIINKRVEMASKMLLKEDYDIESIGKIVGIRDQSYFYRLFKKKTGFTPKQYRNKRNLELS